MDTGRKTAFEILLEIETSAAYSNLSINKFIQRNAPPDPAFVRELRSSFGKPTIIASPASVYRTASTMGSSARKSTKSTALLKVSIMARVSAVFCSSGWFFTL